ncbi:MAG: class I tRNA ligase family protein, partial [Gammaproteobacteria bacterium]
PYITYTPQYIETVWWLLKRLHDKALLYRGHKVLPYCPRCGTALSSHEVAQGYDTIQSSSVFVTFPLADDPRRQLVVWTTTPWTLLSNVAVAVHPDLEYGEYELDGTRYLAAVARAAEVRVAGRPLAEGRVVATHRGRDLVGLRYRRPLDVIPLPPDGQRAVVVAGTFVAADEGTGLVHMAPAFGADDYAIAQQQGLAFVNPVAADGTFQGTGWAEIEGRLVTDKATNHLVIDRLKREGRWLETRSHTHTYPFCWRCDSPLIYYARTSWFIRTSAVRERLLAINARVAWHPPEVGSGRFGEWLANNVDWALSRDRYWGTPLNVWECDAEREHREVIGSYADLAARWGRPLEPEFDPHKPFVDEYRWPCRHCAGTMRRVPEVIDAWFDSGAMPYAQWHYPFEGEAEFAAHFPADFICEGIDQTRGWFYSLLAIAVTAFDQPAYRRVLVNELVLDAAGQKMSKSRGNVVDPWQVIAAHGADAVRLYLLAQSQVWLPKRFDAGQVGEFAGKFLTTLRNTYRFFALYAEDWRPGPGGDVPPVPDRPPVDRWLLARLDETVGETRRAFGSYDVTAGVRAVTSFVVDDLSNWYVRVNRARFWAP